MAQMHSGLPPLAGRIAARGGLASLWRADRGALAFALYWPAARQTRHGDDPLLFGRLRDARGAHPVARDRKKSRLKAPGVFRAARSPGRSVAKCRKRDRFCRVWRDLPAPIASGSFLPTLRACSAEYLPNTIGFQPVGGRSPGVSPGRPFTAPPQAGTPAQTPTSQAGRLCHGQPLSRPDQTPYSRFFVTPGCGSGYFPSASASSGAGLSNVSLSTLGANSCSQLSICS